MKYVKSRNCSFNFDAVSTDIAKNLSLDLQMNPQLVYGLSEADKDLSTFYCRYQNENTLKKYIKADTIHEDEKEEKTFEKFLNVNDHMVNYYAGDLRLPADRTRVTSSLDARSAILIRSKALVKVLLGEFSTEEWFTNTKNSKGSSIGVPYIDTTDMRKFTFPISVTESAKPIFCEYLLWDSRLRVAIKELNSTNAAKHMFSLEKGSRATTVPKNDNIRRMIAIEPTANMFLQQGLMTMMYDRMRTVSLDVDSLPNIHQELARVSSIVGINATIDFSSASDCVSRDFIKWLLPEDWFCALDAVRSPYMSLNGKLCNLNMFSTMGNAVTFPLETIVFFALMQSTVQTLERRNTILPERSIYSKVSVFGDDCIIPSYAANLFIQIAESVGFIVNKDKTFIDDNGFRESCGGDFYHGRNVRPIYIGPPTSRKKSAIEPWLYICLNKIIKKYISYFGSLSYIYEKRVLDQFFLLFRENSIAVKLIPSFYPDDAGLKLAFDSDRLQLLYSKNRFSPIHENKHGQKSFQYLKFSYKQKSQGTDSLALALWLKKPEIEGHKIIHKRDSVFFLTDVVCRYKGVIRQKGGYVVGKGMTSFWSY